MYKKPLIQSIRGQSFAGRAVTVDVLRLDEIHPHVSGNKWYKLKYHLEEALMRGKKGVASYGGAYSNHLVATAYACNERGLKALGIIRGEAPKVYGPSLQQMKELGMELRFVSREDYKNKELLANDIEEDYLIVPEGGAGEAGVRGASEILNGIPNHYSHIICSVGTGTTMAGIVNASHNKQHIIGVSALKVENEINNELIEYIDAATTKKNYSFKFNYHFGGYARKNEVLLSFMNELFEKERIATDFVYTGKLFYAVYDLLQHNQFNPGCAILIVHSGGLQGNRSLPAGILNY
jgi:1-aminocyclopropane-1-carboxylate deaminase